MIYLLAGNIDSPPLFSNTFFHLLPNSPCVDAGNPDEEYWDQEDPANPGMALFPALGTITNDMGAYGGPNYSQWDLVEADENTIPEPSQDITLTNYPNPFNPTTTIEFSIKTDSKIQLCVYNIKGQKVKTLAKSEFTPGSHSIIWNGSDKNNNPVSSGIYFYKLQVNNKIAAVKKCLLLK